jgi:hypothetical protein
MSQITPESSLDLRIARLERQNRMLWRVTVVLVCAFVVFVELRTSQRPLATGGEYTAAGTVRVEKLELTSKDKTVAVITGEGTPGISFVRFSAPSGKEFARLISTPNGGILKVMGESETNTLEMNAIVESFSINTNGVEQVALGKSGLEIKNEKGREVAVLSARGDGGELRLNSPGGSKAVRISYGAKGGGDFELANARGVTVAKLGVLENQGGSFDLCGKTGLSSVKMDVDDKSNGALFVNNGTAKPLIAFGASPAGDGDFVVLDHTGSRAVGVGVLEVGGGAVNVYSEKGEDLVFMGSQAEGRGGIVTMLNRKGKEVVVVGSDETDGGALALTDSNGTLRYHAPPATN